MSIPLHYYIELHQEDKGLLWYKASASSVIADSVMLYQRRSNLHQSKLS